jgi:hypothetical protein
MSRSTVRALKRSADGSRPSRLQPLQVGEQVARAEVHLQLQGGVGEDRLVQEVAGRRLVQARDTDDHADAFQLAHGADKGLTRVAKVAPQTDEGAHARPTLTDAEPRTGPSLAMGGVHGTD